MKLLKSANMNAIHDCYFFNYLRLVC